MFLKQETPSRIITLKLNKHVDFIYFVDTVCIPINEINKINVIFTSLMNVM